MMGSAALGFDYKLGSNGWGCHTPPSAIDIYFADSGAAAWTSSEETYALRGFRAWQNQVETYKGVKFNVRTTSNASGADLVAAWEDLDGKLAVADCSSRTIFFNRDRRTELQLTALEGLAAHEMGHIIRLGHTSPQRQLRQVLHVR